MIDKGLFLEKSQRAILASIPYLLLVMQIDVSQQVSMPLEDLSAFFALQRLASIGMVLGFVLFEFPLLVEHLSTLVTTGVLVHVIFFMLGQHSLGWETFGAELASKCAFLFHTRSQGLCHLVQCVGGKV